MNRAIEGRVTYYRSRTATVSDVLLVLPRSLCEEIVLTLARKAGVIPDNHVVYELHQYSAEDPVYIGVSDFTVTIGRKINIYPNGY